MLIISFDAVGDGELDLLMEYPTVASFAKEAAVFRNVTSVFVTNTYPIHASVATGVKPCEHGIISNTEAFPSRRPRWHSSERGIKARTLWQAAHEKGMVVAAVLWPVTAFSKSIRYNIPEVIARPGERQIFTSLKAGSKFLQLKMFARHHKLLDGISQPNLDNFTTACMVDIYKEYKPELSFVHFTAYDTLCHKYGKNDDMHKMAFEALDRNLKALLDVAEEDVIIFSDHGQLNVHTIVRPNDILVDMGYLQKNDNMIMDDAKGSAKNNAKDNAKGNVKGGVTDGTYMMGESGCFVESCGGCAFLHVGKLTEVQISDVSDRIKNGEGFHRFLSPDEMRESGNDGAALGFCAKEGYCYENYPSGHKATHGYPVDTPGYTVFYMARGCGLTPGTNANGGSLLDIAPLVANYMGLDL